MVTDHGVLSISKMKLDLALLMIIASSTEKCEMIKLSSLKN